MKKDKVNKLIKTQIDIQNEREKEKQIVKLSTAQLIDSYKSDFQAYTRKRLEEFAEELTTLAEKSVGQNISTIEMLNLIKKPNFVVGKTPIYNAEEMSLLFEAYQFIINELNKVKKITPSIWSFCRLAGITSQQFRAYQRSDDKNMRDSTQAIIDYVADINYQLSQHKEIDNITTIHLGKSTLGIVEQNAPQVIANVNVVSVDEAKDKLERLKRGENPFENRGE